MEELDIKWKMAMLSLRINKFQKMAGRKINFNNKHSARSENRRAESYDPAINAVGSVYDAAAEFAMMEISSKAKIEKNEWEVKLVESLARFNKWKASSKNLAKLINSSMTTRTKLGLGFKEYFGSDEVFDLSTPSIFDPKPVTRKVKSLYERFVKAGDTHEVSPSITGTFMPASFQSVLKETQVTFGSKSPTSINTSDSNDFVSCDNNDKSSELETHDFASCVSSPMPADSFSTVNVQILPKSDVKDPSPTNGVSSCSIKENVKPPSDLCNKRRIAARNTCNNNFVRTKTCFVCGSKSHLIKDCHVYDSVDNYPSVVLKAASVPAGSRNSLASTSAGRSIPAASRNRSASIHAGRSIPAASKNRSASIHAGRSIPAASRNRSASIHAGRSIHAASRNRPASIHADKHIPTGRSNKPTPFPAGRTVPTGWINHAARTFFGLTNLCFDNVYWPGIYNHMSINEGRWGSAVHPHVNKDIGIVDSGCSKSMTGNKDKLDDFVQVKGSTVTFGGGGEFQLPDESQVVLRIPKRHDLYTFNLSDVQPEQHINCLLAKASLEESTKWHRRMAHVNFKTINKLAKLGLVEGLPLKLFTNDHNCVACNKRKQHKASYKAISAMRTISEPLQLLHMDLFGPTSIRSIDHKYYSLVITDDFSRFCWAFFLGTKDETFYILKDFIALIQNQLNKKVKAIRYDNETEFQNAKLIALCREKGIKRDYSNARTP
nr:ribonuclease H-like domain-containing protein [Tanacetum cinerariifolium]